MILTVQLVSIKITVFFCFSFLKKILVVVKVTGKNALYKLNPNNAQLTESTRKGKKVLSVYCRSDSAVKFKGFFLVCVELLIFLKIGRNFGPQVLKFLILGLISLFPKDSFHFFPCKSAFIDWPGIIFAQNIWGLILSLRLGVFIQTGILGFVQLTRKRSNLI